MKAFRVQIESFFVAIRSRLIVLATEINESQARLEQASINLVACQLYASLLNKLDAGFLIDKLICTSLHTNKIIISYRKK